MNILPQFDGILNLLLKFHMIQVIKDNSVLFRNARKTTDFCKETSEFIKGKKQMLIKKLNY